MCFTVRLVRCSLEIFRRPKLMRKCKNNLIIVSQNKVQTSNSLIVLWEKSLGMISVFTNEATKFANNYSIIVVSLFINDPFFSISWLLRNFQFPHSLVIIIIKG